MIAVGPFAPNQRSANEQKRRRKFTEEEDNLLKQLVEKLGMKKWEQIAQHVPGRTGRQCRDRYRNYLVPGYFNGQWTQEEDDLIKEKFLQLGPRWSTMTKYFSNRSANALKNRWNYFVCRQGKPAPATTSHENTEPFKIGFDSIDDCGIMDLAFDDLMDLSQSGFDYRLEEQTAGTLL